MNSQQVVLGVALGFSAGLVCGLSLGAAGLFSQKRDDEPRARPIEPKRKLSAAAIESVAYLRSTGKLDTQLSALENASHLIEQIANEEMDETRRSSLIYAASVLRSDYEKASIPVALEQHVNTDEECQQLESTDMAGVSEAEAAVREWIVSNYTAKSATRKKRPKHSLKSIASGIKIAIKFGRTISPPSNDSGFSWISPSLNAAIQQALEGVDEWNYDVLALQTASNGHALQALGWHMLVRWEVVSELKLDPQAVQKWLAFVEGCYRENHYHASVHAADVLQAVHHIILRCGAEAFLDRLTLFSLLIAAMLHDAGHDGLSNAFHENARTDRALAFNDRSIQENFHLATVFRHMAENPAVDLFAALPADQAREARRIVIHVTLATDMKDHFKHTQELKGLVANLGSEADKWQADHTALDQFCANLLHTADLSNPSRPFPLARRWAEAVLSEFFAQGDREQAEGLPVSPLCARGKTVLPTSQVGFINFVVLPYYKVMSEVLPLMKPIVEQLEGNLLQWKTMEAEQPA